MQSCIKGYRKPLQLKICTVGTILGTLEMFMKLCADTADPTSYSFVVYNVFTFRSQVASICSGSAASQVVYSVVCSVAILMVNYIGTRVFSVEHIKSYTMTQVYFSINTYSYIPSSSQSA